MPRGFNNIDLFFITATALVIGIGAGYGLGTSHYDPAEPGLLNEWRCDEATTVIVDIPNDGKGPFEGFHCERVKKGTD